MRTRIIIALLSIPTIAGMALAGGYYFQKPDWAEPTGNGRILIYDPATNSDKNVTWGQMQAAFADAISWDDIIDKPEVFPPADHSQEISTVNGLQPALDSKATHHQAATFTRMSSLEGVDAGSVVTPTVTGSSTGLRLIGSSVWNNGYDGWVLFGHGNTTYYNEYTDALIARKFSVISATPTTQATLNEGQLYLSTATRLLTVGPTTITASGSGDPATKDIAFITPTKTASVHQLADHLASTGNPHSVTYAQLPDKPTIPAAQINSDWTASGTIAEILHKPDFTRGYDGREVELQTSATHVQWRFVGDTSWTNLIALTTITGAPGSNGSNGSNGTDGKTYSCAITGGIRSILYDLNGANPAPTMVAFGIELRENGSVVTPASYTWSVPASGSLLSGSGSAATFTPTVNGTFSAGSADNRVDVAVTYAGITCRATAPVPVTKVGATGAAGSPDTKQQIYGKITVATTGDVLNTECGAADADSFACRTVRAKGGDIHRADLAVGQTWIYARPSDAATAPKFGIKSSSGTPLIQFNADGSFTGTLVIR